MAYIRVLEPYREGAAQAACERLLAPFLGQVPLQFDEPRHTPVHHRTKLLYPVRAGRSGEPLVGIYAYQSHHVVRIDDTELDLIAADRNPRPLRVWLKLDTGMHRLGFDLACEEGMCRLHTRIEDADCPARAIVAK